MAITFTSTMAGASADYMRYLWDGRLVKTDRYKDPVLLDFSLAPVDNSFVKLQRGAYITINSTKYPKWFTGYVVNEPELEFIGSKNGQRVYGYKYQATSDEFVLSLKPIGIVPVFLNKPMGQILKALVEKVHPGVFDVSGIQDGPLVAQYVVDPSQKFIDISQDFCESASFKFYGKDKKLFFKPQDTSGDIITVDGNNKHFTPARLEVRVDPTPVSNDVIVLGSTEPQSYVHEYFLGSGLDSSFPLVSSVFGADTAVLIDESFSGSSIGNGWDVAGGSYLRVDSGYLNCLGGDGSWGTRIQSSSPIPMDGRLRVMHGEWDFVSSGQGVVGGFWASTPSSSLSGCLFGLRVDGLTMSPVVGGTVDSSQSYDLATDRRYVIRTIVEFGTLHRTRNQYNYLKSDGTVASYGGDAGADKATWTTLVTEVDPENGSITDQFIWTNTSVVSSSNAYAWYVPLVSGSLHATVTGITISSPINATLETQSILPIANGGFDEWLDDGPKGWTETINVYREDEFVYSGTSIKLQSDPDGYSGVTQIVRNIVKPKTRYNVQVRLQKSAATTSGQVRIYFTGTDVVETGLVVTASAMSGSFQLFTGVITEGLETIPEDLKLVVDLDSIPDVGAVWVDDLIVTTDWETQMVGPNEIDSMDGLAPTATIINGNAGAETRSSYLGTPQLNPGQAQLVFFKNSLTQQGGAPAANQVIRLSYRGASAAIGRAVSQSSIDAEAAKWGDNGVRSVVRTDIVPRPRTSLECELAAAAIVSEESYVRYSGRYKQYSPYLSAEPTSGSIIKFTNLPEIGVSNEEIREVVTTALSNKGTGTPDELFEHDIEFGKQDQVRKLVAGYAETKGSFMRATDSITPKGVEPTSVGLSFAPDVTHPVLLSWDNEFLYVDAGQDLASNGLFFEVRYTDEGWGVDDAKNLITRTTNRLFTVPRNSRGRVFFIRQAISGNRIKWSEDLSQSSVYSGGSVTRSLKLNPDGVLSDIYTVSLSTGGSLNASFGAASAPACGSFSVKGTAGHTITVNFGGVTKVVKLSGQWQRVSVGAPSSSPSSLSITAAQSTALDLTRFSVESGTLVERSYAKTTNTLYGPVSRYSAVVHASFPTVEVTAERSSDANKIADVTLGEPSIRYSEPDGQGVVYAEITVPVTAPQPLGVFDRMLVQLQAPDDAGEKMEVSDDDGPSVPTTVSATVDPATDVWTATGHPFENGHGVMVRNEGGALPAGVDATLTYVIGNKTPNTFKLYNWIGSVLVDATNAGTGTQFVYPLDSPGPLPVGEPEQQQLVMWADAEGAVKITHRTPAKEQQWRIYVASGSADVINEVVRADKDNPTPSVSFKVGPRGSGVNGVEFADLVSGLTVGTPEYVKNADGQRKLEIPVSWIKPTEDSRYAGIILHIVDESNRDQIATGVEPGTSQRLSFVNFPSKPEKWKIYAVSADKLGNVNSYAKGVTPEQEVTVPAPPEGVAGQERAPLATGFRMAVGFPHYITADGGDSTVRVGLEWDQPDIKKTPELGGYDIVIEYADGHRIQPTSKSANDDPNWVTDPWTVPADPETYKAWLVSWDVNGRRNSIVDGVTPKITYTIQRQSGGTGTEYTSIVSAFNVGTPTFEANGQGQKVLQLPVSWTKPAVPTYGGLVIFGVDPGGTHWELTGVETGSSATITMNDYPATAELWNFYGLSVDTNNRRNTYSALVTPSEGVFIGPPTLGSPGLEYTSNVTGEGVTVQYRVTGEGLEEARFVVSYSAPSDPTFGRAIIGLLRTSPSASITKHEGTTTPWQAIGNGELFNVYIISVDVNGKENSVVNGVTPAIIGIGPTFQTAGAFNGARLLAGSIVNSAAFAATIKPPEVLGVLPTLPNATYPTGRLVFLTTDNKLYRSLGSSWDKAVDGADIITNSIVAGKIAAGAIGTTQLSTTEILIGGGTGKPPRFRMVDNSAGDVAAIGVFTISTPNDFIGIWTKRLKVSPLITSTSPRIEMTSAGLLQIEGASITVSASGGKTVTIDATNGFKTLFSSGNFCTADADKFIIQNAAGTNQTYINQSSVYSQAGSGTVFGLLSGPQLTLQASLSASFQLDPSVLNWNTTSASAGGASALPANPVGYIMVSINGVNRKIAYYA